MKKLSFLTFTIVLLISAWVVAQDNEATEQKQWHTIGRIGEEPPSKLIGVVLKKYATLAGVIGEGASDNLACYQAATDNWAGYNANYHNCLTLVGVVSAAGGVSINTIDGSDVPGDGSENGMKTFGLAYAYNGTNFAPVSIIETQADGQALTLNGIVTSSWMMLYNGATGDLARATANGGLQVGVETWPNSFDAGNGWQKIKKEETGVDEPAKTAGTAVDNTPGGDVGDIVLASIYTLDNPNWCVTIKNAGGGSGDVLSDAAVFVSPSGAGGEWESLTWTTCDNLDVNQGTCSFCCSNCAYAYVKAEALCGVGDDTTVDAWYTANEN